MIKKFLELIKTWEQLEELLTTSVLESDNNRERENIRKKSQRKNKNRFY